MTRYPTELRVGNAGLEGEGYERYELPTNLCANQECAHEATDRHHLFSRGLMGGAFDWVRLADGVETGNIIGLCFYCHKDVTENKAHIVLNPKDYNFYWNDRLLRYQPPKKGEVAGASSDSGEVGATDETRPVCVTCKRPLPRPKIEGQKTEKTRIRKTWSVAVPLDEQEDGAEVIDGLLDLAEEKLDKAGLNWGHGNRVVYYKLTTILGLFCQHADQVLSDS
jgi:hypothetical protein